MHPPEYYFQFLTCAQRVVRTRQYQQVSPDHTAVLVTFKPVADLLQRELTAGELETIAEVMIEGEDAVDECVMWELAHMISHFADERGGATAH